MNDKIIKNMNSQYNTEKHKKIYEKEKILIKTRKSGFNQISNEQLNNLRDKFKSNNKQISSEQLNNLIATYKSK